jgi:hypothetical protein
MESIKDNLHVQSPATRELPQKAIEAAEKRAQAPIFNKQRRPALLPENQVDVDDLPTSSSDQNCTEIGLQRRDIKYESPWNTYERGYDLKLDQFVTVAVRKAPNAGKVAIRQFARRDMNPKLEILQRIRHSSFVNLLEVFEFGGICYAIFEHIFVNLTQVVLCPAYPTEGQLVAILAQVS